MYLQLVFSTIIIVVIIIIFMGGGSRGSNETPLQVNINDGGLKIQAANFQLLANSGGLENKLWVF